MNNQLKKTPVSKVFNNIRYVVPIYQRNYAWGALQIEQLIEDIVNAEGTYFLGNLILNQRDHQEYEVIDGQQRLTTLYLLQTYLGVGIAKGTLSFEARERSNRTLNMLPDKDEMPNELISSEMVDGYHIIEHYFEVNQINKDEFIKKLQTVFLIQIQVPRNIDLNHYFEVMNTRGEQLELHEIAKAKVLDALDTAAEKNTGAMIWEMCADMDSYVQMNVRSELRNKLFSGDWSSLDHSINQFASVNEILASSKEDQASRSLMEILEGRAEMPSEENEDVDEGNERFESTVSFPNFLLHVSNVLYRQNDGESSIDDKQFLDHLSNAWTDAESAKTFLFHMLKLRVLFDKFILKREYARDYKETGRWSLQRIKRNGKKATYVATFGEDAGQNNKQLRTLQSCLRITYTSPKAMHWISVVLAELLEDESTNLTHLLESYCYDRVKQSEIMKTSGFGYDRIAFSYLDYLLYRDGYRLGEKEIIQPLRDDWQFQFRNSIEHFFPQNPFEGERWEKKDLDGYGNLALITVSGNSRFSNLPPGGKINSYPKMIEQSLKLVIMKERTHQNDGNWTEEVAAQHKDEMFDILLKR
ncbi:DUF262 domain-containing HNH endonuclease family protein [Alkalihalobacillus sp. FSL W8-0930]